MADPLTIFSRLSANHHMAASNMQWAYPGNPTVSHNEAILQFFAISARHFRGPSCGHIRAASAPEVV